MSKHDQPGSETAQQKVLVQLLNLHGIDFYHVPNGEYRHKVTAKKLKGMGVKAGVPDLCIVTPPPLVPYCRGVYIEMKALRGGRVSNDQRLWINKLKVHRYFVFVAHGWQDAAKQLTALGYNLGTT